MNDKNSPPPNPFYHEHYRCSLSSGHADLSIPAPGGKISPIDAQDAIDWLMMVIKRLERKAHTDASAALGIELREEQP